MGANGITVDNLDFSTLSTDFSTGDLRRKIEQKVQVDFFISQHNTQRVISTNSHFFRDNHFDQNLSKERKKILDKIFMEKIKKF